MQQSVVVVVVDKHNYSSEITSEPKLRKERK